MPVKGQHARQGIAVGGIARVAHVHRAGRIGRDELNQDALRLARSARAEVLARGEHLGERARQPGVRQEQVHEARAGDLEALEARPEALLQRVPEALGDLARRRPSAGASSSAALVE